ASITLIHSSLFSLIIPPPPISTLFPYTTLFRSLASTAQSKQVRQTATINLMELAAHDEMPEAFDSYARELASAPMSPWLRRLVRSEEHTSELQSRSDLVCRLLLEKKKTC